MFLFKHSLKTLLYTSVFSALFASAGALSAGERTPAEELLFGPAIKQSERSQADDQVDKKTADPQSQTQKDLSLQSVLRHTYTNNPTLQAARAELKAVHEQLPQAFAGWRPTISSEASITSSQLDGSNFGGGDGSTAKDVAVSLDQPLFSGGSTFAEVAAAKHTIQAQKALLISREQDVLQSVITSYSDVLRDQTLLNISRDIKDIIAKELEAAEARFEVGELTKTDVSQAKARLARADSDVITARGNLNTSKAVFVEVTGLVPEALIQLELKVEPPLELDKAILQAEQTSPTVMFAAHAHRAAEEDVDGVFGELLPSIGLFGSWNRTYDPSPGIIDEQTNRAVGLSATIPLYQAGAVRSRVRQAKHTANQRYLEILEARRLAEQEVVSSWSEWQASRAEITSRQAQLEASEVAKEGVKAEAEFGSRTVLDVLDADQELFDAKVALVNAQRDEAVTKYDLMATLGLLTPETLGFPELAFDYNENADKVANKIFDMNVDSVK